MTKINPKRTTKVNVAILDQFIKRMQQEIERITLTKMVIKTIKAEEIYMFGFTNFDSGMERVGAFCKQLQTAASAAVAGKPYDANTIKTRKTRLRAAGMIKEDVKKKPGRKKSS